MEPNLSACINNNRTDAQLWGPRPVLWGLRMLGPDPVAMIQSLSAGEQREAADFLGVSLSVDGEDADDRERLAARIDERARVLDHARQSDAVLYSNLRGLQQAIGFDDASLDIVTFRAMLRLHTGFEALAGKYIGLCCDFVFHRKLARLFDLPEHAVATALAPSSPLVTSGLMTVAAGVLGSLEHRIRLLNGLIIQLVVRPAEPAELLKLILPVSRPPSLSLSAYPHLTREIELLTGHLRSSLAVHALGTNVLLYGRPGTGKSEMAAALAAAVQCPLYPSEPAPDDCESLTPRERFRELVQLQRLVRIAGAGIVLVDEAEDLFPTVWSDASKSPTKAAVNECLETNPTPTIWISNRTQHMDEAFLRRFDLVIHVPALPASAKRSLLQNALPLGTLDDREIRHYAAQRELSPAIITRMARVAVDATDGSSGNVRANLQVLSRHYLETLGAAGTPDTSSSSILEHDIRLLNTDPPVDSVMRAIATSRVGARMLLHGLPGTGKTAFGKALAESLDKPLLQQAASSLLSCYVGDTEKNLRDMFDEARHEDGVLLLDEADSFLRSRDQARARWEVTQTNELLLQMEAFEGVFICTTNRLDDLDPAALRRFDFKVEFRPLRAEQRELLVQRCCAVLGLDPSVNEPLWSARADRLDGLTPGDAAAALRRLRLSAGTPSIDTLLNALADECRYKPRVHKAIGFLQ